MKAEATSPKRMDAVANGGRVSIFAAGSLKAAVCDAAEAFQAKYGLTVAPTFGASGLLRQRIEAGAEAELFLSADMNHPQELASRGLATTVRPLLQNRLCLILREGLAIPPGKAVETLLDPAVAIGMSTPGNDPSGDYALELFRLIERERPGAFAMLNAKAERLTGAPGTPKAPGKRNLYGWLMEKPAADIFVTYRTNAAIALAEVPTLSVVELPSELAVEATYGLAQLHDASPRASSFAEYLAGRDARAIFERYGFTVAEPARSS